MSESLFLDFEKPIAELQKKISDLREFPAGDRVSLDGEIASLEKKLDKLRSEIYSGLSRWQRVQLSRHPRRPYTLDYVDLLLTDFIEIHGDRGFREDRAMICGLGKLQELPLVLVGQQKGRDTKQKLYRNFGMAHPEGYRKARRAFYLAERFRLPILCLIDTPGAYPGIGAEERGQAEAIAKNIQIMFELSVPVVCVIIGEGASGGALGIGVGDRVLMMEYAWYSVISPEGCAAILWRDAAKAPEAAEQLKPTATDLVRLGIVDGIIPEPPGGAHNDHRAAADALREAVLAAFGELAAIPVEQLLDERLRKYRRMGPFAEG